jgi:hypothetical protein
MLKIPDNSLVQFTSLKGVNHIQLYNHKTKITKSSEEKWLKVVRKINSLYRNFGYKKQQE